MSTVLGYFLQVAEKYMDEHSYISVFLLEDKGRPARRTTRRITAALNFLLWKFRSTSYDVHFWPAHLRIITQKL